MNTCLKHGLRVPYGDDCYMCNIESTRKEDPLKPHNYFGELHQAILTEVVSRMSNEDKIEMHLKCQELAATKKFANYESRLVFEDAFRSGYLATRTKQAK